MVDQTMPSPNVGSLIPPEKARLFTRQADLDSFIEKQYNPKVLKALQTSVKSQHTMLGALKEAGLNGQAEGLERIYRIHTQELKRKETLLGKVWSGVTAPFRFIGRQFKEHPVRTTLIAALLIGGAYLYFSGTGAALLGNARNWLVKRMGGEMVADAGAAAKTGAEKVAEGATGALEAAKGAVTGAEAAKNVQDYSGIVEEIGNAARDLPMPE